MRNPCARHKHPRLRRPITREQVERELGVLCREAGISAHVAVWSKGLERTHQKNTRRYAQVLVGLSPIRFELAPQTVWLPGRNRRALLAHEVGHVLDPKGGEDDADAAAECYLGVKVGYDRRWPAKGLQVARNPEYWEDLSEKQKESWRKKRRRQLERVLAKKYPVKARIGGRRGEQIVVLGPVDLFEPYKSHPARSSPGAPPSWKDAMQLMAEFSKTTFETGRNRAIVMATSVFSGKGPWVDPFPPARSPRGFFGSNPDEPLRRAERRSKQTGSDEDLARYLSQLLRTGQTSTDKLRLLARMGAPERQAAMFVLGKDVPIRAGFERGPEDAIRDMLTPQGGDPEGVARAPGLWNHLLLPSSVTFPAWDELRAALLRLLPEGQQERGNRYGLRHDVDDVIDYLYEQGVMDERAPIPQSWVDGAEEHVGETGGDEAEVLSEMAVDAADELFDWPPASVEIERTRRGYVAVGRAYHYMVATAVQLYLLASLLAWLRNESPPPVPKTFRVRKNPAPERYVSPRERALAPRESFVRDVAIALKGGELWAIGEAARAMAPLVPRGAVLVPMPGHQAGDKYMGTRALAGAISRHVGGVMAPVLERVSSVPSSRLLRLAGQRGLDPEAHARSMLQSGPLPPGPVVLIDNVVVSGATFEGAKRALGVPALAVAYAEAEDLALPPVGERS